MCSILEEAVWGIVYFNLMELISSSSSVKAITCYIPIESHFKKPGVPLDEKLLNLKKK